MVIFCILNRVVFYKYDTDGERVWQAGATEVVVNSQTYQDIIFHHTVIPLTAGLEVIIIITLIIGQWSTQLCTSIFICRALNRVEGKEILEVLYIYSARSVGIMIIFLLSDWLDFCTQQ